MAAIGDGSHGAIVLVEADDTLRRSLARLLRAAGFGVFEFESASEALAGIERPDEIAAVLADLHLPEAEGTAFLDAVAVQFPEIAVVLMTTRASETTPVDAMRSGAYDFVVKPLESEAYVARVVARAAEHTTLLRRTRHLERQLADEERLSRLVGNSASMRKLFGVVESVAGADVTVLVQGESGTGKELVARAIHERSARRGRAFVGVSCTVLTETLLESELFGHVRGAFSGAIGPRRGLFEEAGGGTLFLDEVGELTDGAQVRLLHALEQREIRPAASDASRPVNSRVIAASSQDLDAAVRAGTFRDDLYHRLAVFRLVVPPLRNRVEDIGPLAAHFLRIHGDRIGRQVTRIEPKALDLLVSNPWPGNVRELENAIQRALVLTTSDCLTAASLPRELRPATKRGPDARPYELGFNDAKHSVVEAFERRYVERLLSRVSGNVAEAARTAGLEKSNFRRLLRRHGIDASEFRVGGARVAEED